MTTTKDKLLEDDTIKNKKGKQMKFVDDAITNTENDIQKVQQKPAMYISYTGESGALHLAKEAINNMIDECVNAKSPGKFIKMILDQKNNTLYVSDDGRGIPFESMFIACTELQAGSKKTRSEGGGSSAGENGVGLTATNALSERFELISRRYGEKATLKFENGVLISEAPLIEKEKKSLHGTTNIFKPSEFYLAKQGESATIPVEGLMKWLDMISHLLPPDIEMELQVLPIGKEAVIIKNYQNENGMYDYLQKMSKRHTTLPIHIRNMVEVEETYRGKVYERHIGFEVAFAYDHNDERMSDSTPRTEAFCNFIQNVDGGTHINSALDAVVRYLTKQTRNALSESEAKKVNIMKTDVTTGLDMAVYLATDVNPEFSGQTKEKVTSTFVIPYITDIVKEGLENLFNNDPKLLKKLTDRIKTVAKARIAANKERSIVLKNKMSAVDEHSIRKYSPANAKGKNDYREILFIEGESAAGSVNKKRFKQFQATYGMRGIPLNAMDAKLPDILKNTEFRDIIQITRAGYGKNFNLDECYFDKFIIMTDGDADGNNITSSLCVFFLIVMRAAVEAGMVYKAYAPLYSIEDKEHKYLTEKKEYYQVYYKRVSKEVKLITADGVVMPEEATRSFFEINKKYLERIERLASFYSIHPDIIEQVAMHGNEKNFAEIIHNRFEEITYEDGLISGIYEGKFQAFNINKKTNKRLEKLRKLIFEDNHGIMEYRLDIKNADGTYKQLGDKLLTLGELLRHCEKYKPKILSRFKGLGEIDENLLKETTLDPNKRTLVQLTVDDLEKALAEFGVLHGSSKEQKQLRKELVASFEIDQDELDN